MSTRVDYSVKETLRKGSGFLGPDYPTWEVDGLVVGVLGNRNGEVVKKWGGDILGGPSKHFYHYGSGWGLVTLAVEVRTPVPSSLEDSRSPLKLPVNSTVGRTEIKQYRLSSPTKMERMKTQWSWIVTRTV